jgi:O-antigen/teichoic acid export membrane protein
VSDVSPLASVGDDVPARDSRDRLFDVESETIRRSTISGGVITGLAQGTHFVLQIGTIAMLSRLLGPDAFGIVAMVATVGGFLRMFTEAGMTAPTIQRAEITHGQVSNLFWVNATLGALLAVALVALAPVLAWFYREPRLVPVASALAPVFLLNGLAVQHIALLRRRMRYQVLAFAPVVATLAGTVAAFALARAGASYWSLVGMQVTTALISCALLWSFSGWLPGLPVRGSGTWPLFSFGMKVAFSNSLWTLVRSLDGVLVGRVWGVDALGLYSRGGALMMRPLEQIMAPLDGLILPALSRLQAEPERFRSAAFQIYDLIAMMSMVISGVLLALSWPLTLLILGPQWTEAAPIFATFTLVAFYMPLSLVSNWFITSQGRGLDVMRFSGMTSAVTAALLVASVPFGPLGVAIALAGAGMLIQLPLAHYMVGRSGFIRTGELWRHLFRQLPLWFLVVAVCYMASRYLGDAPLLLQVGIATLAGLLAAAAFVFAFPRNRHMLRSMVDSMRARR